MSDSTFEAAMKRAADRFLKKRRASSARSLGETEISFVAARYGLAPDIIDAIALETRKGGVRARRFECDLGPLQTALHELDETSLSALRERTGHELGAIRRAAKRCDPRYDINRHAALMRLSRLLDAMEGRGMPATTGPTPAGRQRKRARRARAAPFPVNRSRGPDAMPRR